MVRSSQRRFLLFSNYLNLFGFSLFAPLYALFATGVGAKPQLVGLSYAVNTLASAIMILTLGRLEDRVRNKRTLVVVGYFWLAAGAFSFLLVHTVSQLFVVQIFNAIGTGILAPAWKAAFSHSQQKGREASQWSLYDGGNLLATSAGAAVSGIVLATAGFRATFALMGGIQIIAAFLSMYLLSDNLR
jgi:MFS family permease